MSEMTYKDAINRVDAILANFSDKVAEMTKSAKLRDTLILARQAMTKLQAIEQENPFASDWELYSNRLYDLAYAHGYTDAKNGKPQEYGEV